MRLACSACRIQDNRSQYIYWILIHFYICATLQALLVLFWAVFTLRQLETLFSTLCRQGLKNACLSDVICIINLQRNGARYLGPNFSLRTAGFYESHFVYLQVVQEYERAVIFRIGRLVPGGAKGPGRDIAQIYRILSLCSWLEFHSLRLRIVPYVPVILNPTHAQRHFFLSCRKIFPNSGLLEMAKRMSSSLFLNECLFMVSHSLGPNMNFSTTQSSNKQIKQSFTEMNHTHSKEKRKRWETRRRKTVVAR